MPIYDFQCDECKVVYPDVLVSIEESNKLRCSETITFKGIDVVCAGKLIKTWFSKQAHSIVGDSIPGGIWLENYGPDPIKFYSHTEIRREHKKRRVDPVTGQEYYLTPFVRHVGVPGSDKSPHTTNWGRGIDAYTLRNAEILVARAAEQKDKPVPTPGGRHTDTENQPGFMDSSIRPFNRTATLPVDSGMLIDWEKK